MERKSIGTLMAENKREGMKTLGVAMAVLLYGAVLIFTGVHNYNLFSRAYKADEQVFVIFALLCLEGAAIFLPIAVHFWFAPGPQRMVGYILYGVEFGIILANTIVDSMTNTGNTPPEWLHMYSVFIAPASPIVIGIGIAMIFLLDPSKKIHDAVMATKAASIDAMAVEMRAAADSDEVAAHVTEQARQRTRIAVGMTNDAPQLPAPRRPAEVVVTNAPVQHNASRRWHRPYVQLHRNGSNGGPKAR